MSVRFNTATTNTENSENAISGASLWARLTAWTRPHCPGCKGEMVFRYKMPAEYREASPQYYQCSSCRNCYCRMFTGPWIRVASHEVPRA